MPKLVRGIDLYAPGGLTALFALHKARFGNMVMLGRLEEIRTRQVAIKNDLDALETQDETDEIQTRADALLQEWDEIDAESIPLQTRADKIKLVREAIAQESNIEPPPAGTGGNAGRMAGSTGPDLHVRTQEDPYRDMDGVRMGLVPPAQIRSRAMHAIEQYNKRTDHYALPDAGAARCAELIEKGGKVFGTNVARQMLATGSPEYLASFEQYLADPGGYSARAALSLTSANGGYLVPFTLDPTIILTNAGSANPYRQIANIKTTATNTWNGVTSAGVNAAWTAEGVEAADNTPTVGPLVVTPQKATAYLFGSFEVLGDSDFASQLPELLGDAKDRIEETAFAVGTGSGQPNGVIPLGTVYSLTGNAAGPRAADAYALQAALPARYRGPNANNVWLGNLNTINAFRNLPKFTGSTQSIVDDSGDVPRMLGKPFYESTSIVGTFATTNKVLAYLDGNQFYIVDRVGMSVVYDPIVLGATNRIPTGQGAWYAFWRVGSNASTATAIRVLSLLT